MKKNNFRKSGRLKRNPFVCVSSRNSKVKRKKRAKGGHQADLKGPLGFLALCLSLVSAISLVSNLYDPSHNVMGRYLGFYLSTYSVALGGKVPSLFFPVILFLTGWNLLLRKDPAESYRRLFFAGLLFVEFCVLLSIGNLGEGKSWEQFNNTGGVLGNFIVQNMLVLVFGTQKIGAFFVTMLTVIGTLIWGMRVDVVQLMVRLRFAVEWLSLHAGAKVRNLALAFSGGQRGMAYASVPRGGVSPSLEREKKSMKKKSALAVLEPEDDEDEVKELEELTEEELAQLPVSKALIARLEKRQREFLKDQPGLVIREMVPGVSETDDEPVVEVKTEKPRRASKKAEKKEPEAADIIEKNTVEDSAVPPVPQSLEDSEANEERQPEPDAEEVPEPEPVYDEYRMPDIEMLEGRPAQGRGITEEEISANARKLEEKLKDYRINGVISEVCPGPVITRYELQLAPGQKVAQVESLARDLAVAMAVQKIRISLVEGKSAIGIELPNPKRQMVFLKECAQAPEFKSEDDEIKLVLGKDPAGFTVIVDLVKMPHMLIAGTTGSGKSVCTNTFLASLLLSKRPDEVKLILVDPKVVEMSIYNGIPHLLSDVITTPKETISALKWTVAEMNRRYQVLAHSTCRNIAQFNEKVKDGSVAYARIDDKDKKRMPYIVIIIDELADLMLSVGKELEEEIVKIAQKARAVGIHLVLATQRPEAKIVTGLIKSNMPCKVALTVNTSMDSRIIIDEKGAEALLGRGDMLFKSVEMRDAKRIHGAFMETRESEKLIEFSKNQNVKKERIQSFEKEEKRVAVSLPDGLNPEIDELRQAAQIIVSRQMGSTSLLQRKMSIGYAKAGRLMDQLEEAGIVGPNMGSKVRDVMVSSLDAIDAYISTYAKGGLDFKEPAVPQ